MKLTKTTPISELDKMKEIKYPIANPSAILREEFDDWAVLYDPDAGEGSGLNPVGVFIWKRLDGKNRVEDIAAELRKECDDAPADAEDAVRRFIGQLAEKGLAGNEFSTE